MPFKFSNDDFFEYDSSDKIDELPEWSDIYPYSRKTQGETHRVAYT